MLTLSAMSTSKPVGTGRQATSTAAAAGAKDRSSVQTFCGTKRKTPSHVTPARGTGTARHTHRGLLALTTDKTAAALMEEYGFRLRKLAKRMNDHKASLGEDDLVQVGLLGLIEAWHVYEKDDNPRFWLYAYARVKGAMVDEVRAMRQFSRRVGRRFHMEQYIDEIHDTGAEPAPEPELRCWADYLTGLPEREKQIVGLYIIRELGLRRIGLLYGVSESRVQQIVAKALKTLKGNMQ